MSQHIHAHVLDPPEHSSHLNMWIACVNGVPAHHLPKLGMCILQVCKAGACTARVVAAQVFARKRARSLAAMTELLPPGVPAIVMYGPLLMLSPAPSFTTHPASLRGSSGASSNPSVMCQPARPQKVWCKYVGNSRAGQGPGPEGGPA
eukprot:354135-Chlamydomonas_euryale.AAC.10